MTNPIRRGGGDDRRLPVLTEVLAGPAVVAPAPARAAPDRSLDQEPRCVPLLTEVVDQPPPRRRGRRAA
jgi:hypothetical protein